MSARAAMMGTEAILLVEDAQPVRAMIRRALQRSGYRVLEADGGAAAIAIASGPEPIDLLVTDVVMPVMSGRVLAEQFEALRPGTRVLYMSGYTEDAVMRHGISRALVAYIQKPFAPDDIVRKVRTVLDSP